ncbi:MAG: TonB-dependent receptor [Bacteroidota bacterium]
MKKSVLLFLALMGILLPCTMGQNMAWGHYPSTQVKQGEKKVPLSLILHELAEVHEVFFSYDLSTVESILVVPINLYAELQVALEQALHDTGLNYKKVGVNNYVIFKEKVRKKKKWPSPQMLEQKQPQETGDIQSQSLQQNRISSPTKGQNVEIVTFTVRGQMLDETGLEMIGATVQSKMDPSIGSITDYEGRFEIELPAPTDTLVFSYAGYKERLEPVTGRSEINITLLPDLQTLDEVVVVGFGTQKKRFTTGSVGKVNGEALQNSNQATLENSLQGRIAGVQVTSSDGMAGSPVSIRIRGTSSIVASSEPLYVVDGVPIVSGNYSVNNANGFRLATARESNALAQLNPADIESIDILKDASAAAIYGSRGANGVVLITTKKGKEGKTKFNVGYQSGFSKETNRIDLIDGPTYLELAKEAWTNSYNDTQNDNIVNNDGQFDIANDYEKFWQTILPEGLSRETAESTNTDWIDLALQRGHFHEANISASGGNAKTLFYLGGTYRDEKGIFVGNNFERYNVRVNLDHKANSVFTLGARAAYTVTDNDIIPTSWAGGLGTAQSQALPFWPVYNEDGTFFNAQSGNNVAAELANTEMNQKGTSILGNVYAQANLFQGLTIRTEFGVNNIYKKEFYYRSAVIEPDAIATSVLSESINWNTNNTINYSNVLGAHGFDVLVGMNATSNDFFTNIINGETFPNPALKNPENAATQTASITQTGFSFLSAFTRLNYRFKERYLLSFSLRRDGSSRFGQGNRWGTFPAVSLGWIISDEDFLANSEVLTFLKLRASYGETGNAEIGNFEYFGAYESQNYVDKPGIVVSEIDNPGLGWESTRQYNIGIDYGLWEGRIEGGVDVYLQQTRDLLTEIDISSLSGVGRVTSNVGSLENRGVDFSITSHNLKGKLKWVTTLNLAYNANKITDLGGLDFIPSQIFGLGAVGLGQPVGARFRVEWAGIAAEDMTLTVTDPDTENPVEIQVKGGDELFINQFGELTNIYDPNDNVFYGNPIPTWTGGLTNSFSYKNFDLSVLITFAAGNDLSNEEQLYQYYGFGHGWTMWADVVDRWQQPGDQTDIQRLTWRSSNRNFASSRVTTAADFARLKDVTLGYNFPKALMQKWHLGNIRFYARGTNLFTLTSYEGWDPEYNRDGAGSVNQGKSWLPSPQAKSISFGLNVTF